MTRTRAHGNHLPSTPSNKINIQASTEHLCRLVPTPHSRFFGGFRGASVQLSIIHERHQQVTRQSAQEMHCLEANSEPPMLSSEWRGLTAPTASLLQQHVGESATGNNFRTQRRSSRNYASDSFLVRPRLPAQQGPHFVGELVLQVQLPQGHIFAQRVERVTVTQNINQ